MPSRTNYCPRFVSNLPAMMKRPTQERSCLMAASMLKRGPALTVPVSGVAFPKWSLERLHKRMTDNIERSGGIDNRHAFKVWDICRTASA
jgi:hypothetical protein